MTVGSRRLCIRCGWKPATHGPRCSACARYLNGTGKERPEAVIQAEAAKRLEERQEREFWSRTARAHRRQIEDAP